MHLAGAYQRCEEESSSSLLPWIVCFSATMFFFYEFIQGNMFASIAGQIMQDFKIQADKMAYLSSIYYLSNVIFLFVAGMVLDRYSIKKTLLFAMFLCVASTFCLAYSHSFYVALLSRFITGIGSAFCFLGPVRLASHWFLPRRMALVTGVIVTIAMSGGMMAQYPMTKLISYVGWRQAVVDVGLLGVSLLFVMFFGIKERPTKRIHQEYKVPNVFDAAKKAYLNRNNVQAAMYTSLMNMAIAVFGAMIGTLYLEQRLGVNASEASFINGMLFVGAIVGAPVIGYISDKMGVRLLPMRVSALISLLIVLLALYAPVSSSQMLVLFFLLGFFTSGQVISYALVSESASPAMTATAVSVISILTQGGYLVYQNLFSRLLMGATELNIIDGVPTYPYEAYQQAAIMIPIGLLIALLMALSLKETYCRQIGHKA